MLIKYGCIFVMLYGGGRAIAYPRLQGAREGYLPFLLQKFGAIIFCKFSIGEGVSFFVLIKGKMQDVPVCHDERIDLSIGRSMTIFFAREDVICVIFVEKSMFFIFFMRFLLKNLDVSK